MSRFVSIAVVVMLVACGKPKDASIDPAHALIEPPHHRVTPAACSPAPPGSAYPPSGQPQLCFADSDCRDGGADGHCRGSVRPQGSGGASFDNACIYDECVDDMGCPPTSLCDCRNAAHGQGNICMVAACKRDSDCGSPGFCSASARLWVPTYGQGYPNPRGEGVEYGYYCHTPLDECSDDTDCSNADGGHTDTDHCAFDSKAGHWRCAMWVGAPD